MGGAFGGGAEESLIPRLPDHLAAQQILPRISWWDFESARRVSRSWRSAIQQQSVISRRRRSSAATTLGCIHPNKLRRGQQQQQQQLQMAISILARSPKSGWETLPPIPGLPCAAPLSGRCICVGSRLFVIGGRDPRSWEFLPDVFSLDLNESPAGRSWRRCAPMSTARSAFACAAAGGKIIVAGGQGDEILTLAAAEVYDIGRDAWEPLPDLNIPRTECNAAVIGDRIFVIGGYSSSIRCQVEDDESPDSFCDYDDDSASTFWVSSADAISLGSKRWETVEALDQGARWEVGSGILQSVDKSVVRNLLRRSSGQSWSVLDGKIVRSGGGGEAEELMFLAAAGGQGEMYACSCSLDSSAVPVKVKVGLCKTVQKIDVNGSSECVDWERVDCPFELSRYGASCFLV